MIYHVYFFESNCTINTSLIEQAKIIASHMHETGETEDALVWLLDELDKLVLIIFYIDFSRCITIIAYILEKSIENFKILCLIYFLKINIKGCNIDIYKAQHEDAYVTKMLNKLKLSIDSNQEKRKRFFN